MEGVTHPALREMIASRGGVGVVCTEFVRVTKNPLGKKALKKHVVRPSRGALSVQVMGNDLFQMAEATELVTMAGADIVDINLGCPAPRAVRKGVGSAMLKDLKLLGRVVEAMRSRTSRPLSAKIRAGYDDSSGVLEIARVVQDSGADFLTVHPRRRVDFYDGVADWRIIARLALALSIPVVGNGDVWYAADALRMRKETGCQAVMLGRPVLRNPWIFLQIAALQSGEIPLRPTGDDVVRHVMELLWTLRSSFTETATLGMMKEQIRYLGRTIDDGGAFCKQALRQETTAALVAQVQEKMAGLSASELDLGAEGGSLMRSGTAETVA